MRKDVRMGFAVGGVLFAVIIVAVLVVHHNKNQGKAVGIDLTGKAAPVDTSGEVDVASGSTGSASNKQTDPSPAQIDQPKPLNGNNQVAGQGKPALDSAADSGKGDKWDQLFVSTADDPIKELASSPQKASRHNADNAPDSKARVTGVNREAEVNPLIQPDVDRHDIQADPPLPGPAATPRSTPRTHRIALGESFASISRMVYGSGRYASAIAKANPSVNPSKLKPGSVIQLPSEADVKRPAPHSQIAQAPRSGAKATVVAAGPALSPDKSTYTVQSGDNLYSISRKLYGNGSKGDELYTANKDKIGPDKGRLKLGMVLSLPEKPTVAAR